LRMICFFELRYEIEKKCRTYSAVGGDNHFNIFWNYFTHRLKLFVYVLFTRLNRCPEMLGKMLWSPALDNLT
jgi:hypothetical protein